MDVIKHCGTPRYLHSDFPLGNPCGKPYDTAMQTAITLQALGVAMTAKVANTIERTPFIWSDNNSWRDNYARVDESNRQRLQELGETRRRLQAEKKQVAGSRSPMLSVE